MQVGIDLRQRNDDAFEGFFFLAQFQGTLLVVPDFRVFQFGIDLL